MFYLHVYTCILCVCVPVVLRGQKRAEDGTRVKADYEPCVGAGNGILSSVRKTSVLNC